MHMWNLSVNSLLMLLFTLQKRKEETEKKKQDKEEYEAKYGVSCFLLWQRY